LYENLVDKNPISTDSSIPTLSTVTKKVNVIVQPPLNSPLNKASFSIYSLTGEINNLTSGQEGDIDIINENGFQIVIVEDNNSKNVVMMGIASPDDIKTGRLIINSESTAMAFVIMNPYLSLDSNIFDLINKHVEFKDLVRLVEQALIASPDLIADSEKSSSIYIKATEIAMDILNNNDSSILRKMMGNDKDPHIVDWEDRGIKIINPLMLFFGVSVYGENFKKDYLIEGRGGVFQIIPPKWNDPIIFEVPNKDYDSNQYLPNGNYNISFYSGAGAAQSSKPVQLKAGLANFLKENVLALSFMGVPFINDNKLILKVVGQPYQHTEEEKDIIEIAEEWGKVMINVTFNEDKIGDYITIVVDFLSNENGYRNKTLKKLFQIFYKSDEGWEKTYNFINKYNKFLKGLAKFVKVIDKIGQASEIIPFCLQKLILIGPSCGYIPLGYIYPYVNVIPYSYNINLNNGIINNEIILDTTPQLSGIVQNAASLGRLSDVKVSVFKDNSLIKQTTTDSDGIYSLNIPAGSGYYVTFEKTGYVSTKYENVEVPEDMTTYLEAVLQVSNDYAGRGDVEGVINSALEKDKGVADLTLNFRQGINVKTGNIIATAKTGSNGSYTVTNLESGNYTVEISGTGYQTNYFTVVCLGGKKNSGQNGTVTPILSAGETRIVLTWGASPNDLDSHLVGPASSGSFHTYFSKETYTSNNIKYADLDLDDTSSYGPETTTIYHQTDGTYRFYVHDYSNSESSNSNALSNSGAQVKVYRGDKVLTFNVPTNLRGTLWTVFELNGDTIKPINTMSYQSNEANIGTGQSTPTTPTNPTTVNDYPTEYRDATCADCLAVCCASDRWGFCIKNGTSYVAWRMNRDGGEGSFSNTMRNGHWGNADNWDQNAAQLGMTVNNIPVRGAVAQWNKDEIDVQHLKDYGHVAYVESVNSNGTINISEYNYNRCGYGERSNVSAPRYIHINQ